MPAHPRDTWPKPNAKRILLAFLGAPASATSLVAAVISIGISIGAGKPEQDWVMFIVVFIAEFLVVFIVGFLFVALPLTVLFGIPLFLILREHVRLTFWASSLAGVAVLYLPLSVLLLFSPAFKYALDDGHGPGWLEIVESLGAVAALGAVAGFVFWVIAAAGLKPEKQDAAVVHSGAQPRPEEAESEPVIPENVA